MSYLENPKVYVYKLELIYRVTESYMHAIFNALMLDLSTLSRKDYSELLRAFTEQYVSLSKLGFGYIRYDEMHEEREMALLRTLFRYMLKMGVLVDNDVVYMDEKIPLGVMILNKLEELSFNEHYIVKDIRRSLNAGSDNDFMEYEVRLLDNLIIIKELGDYRINRFYEEGLR